MGLCSAHCVIISNFMLVDSCGNKIHEKLRIMRSRMIIIIIVLTIFYVIKTNVSIYKVLYTMNCLVAAELRVQHRSVSGRVP